MGGRDCIDDSIGTVEIASELPQMWNLDAQYDFLRKGLDGEYPQKFVLDVLGEMGSDRVKSGVIIYNDVDSRLKKLQGITLDHIVTDGKASGWLKDYLNGYGDEGISLDKSELGCFLNTLDYLTTDEYFTKNDDNVDSYTSFMTEEDFEEVKEYLGDHDIIF